MKAAAGIEETAIRQQCRLLRLPTIGAQFRRLAEEALQQKQTHGRYLEALLGAELEDREQRVIQRRLWEARLPRVKTLEEFDFAQAPQISANQVRELAEGGYLARAEPVILLGEAGTGKTHLATALCVAACRQRRRARFTTAAGLVNELVEARQQGQLSRALGRGGAMSCWPWMSWATCRWPKWGPSCCFRSSPSGPKRRP